MMTATRLCYVAGLVGLLGCAPRVPVPPSGPHEADTPVIVPYPPPPARVQMLSPRPNDAAVWVDGCWSWTRERFVWLPGGWQRPPHPDAYYAPATTVRGRNGKLFYYVGAWHLPSGTVIPKTGAE